MHVKEQTEPLDRNAKNSNLFGDDSNAYSTEFELRNCIEDFSVPPPPPKKRKLLILLSSHFLSSSSEHFQLPTDILY